MSKGPEWVSAADFMAQLQQDPEFQRQAAERERAHAELVARIRAGVEPVLGDLRGAGIAVNEWDELLARYAPLPRPAIDVLLSWLPRVQDERVKEMLVRALGATTEPFDGRELARAFEASDSESFRWALANTLSLANPTGLEDWLLRAAADPASGRAREMLAVAVARLAPRESANQVLLRLLDELPGNAAQGLALSGGEPEAAALEAARTRVFGWKRREIDKAIRTIRKRTAGGA